MVTTKGGEIINAFPQSDGTVKLELVDEFDFVIAVELSKTDALILGSGLMHLGHGGS